MSFSFRLFQVTGHWSGPARAVNQWCACTKNAIQSQRDSRCRVWDPPFSCVIRTPKSPCLPLSRSLSRCHKAILSRVLTHPHPSTSGSLASTRLNSAGWLRQQPITRVTAAATAASASLSWYTKRLSHVAWGRHVGRSLCRQTAGIDPAAARLLEPCLRLNCEKIAWLPMLACVAADAGAPAFSCGDMSCRGAHERNGGGRSARRRHASGV